MFGFVLVVGDGRPLFTQFCFSLVDFPSSVRVHLLTKMADIEYRLSVGTNEKIQLSSLIAAFQVTRDLIVTEA